NILITPIDYPGQKNVRHAIIDRIINGDQSSVPSQILNIVPLIEKRKAQYCDLEGQNDVTCDYEQHDASIVSEQINIPSSSQHLNLVGKALC
ncbi:11311_t:CDS:2, partial [Funneliformis geosporum]